MLLFHVVTFCVLLFVVRFKVCVIYIELLQLTHCYFLGGFYSALF